jgi:hypothetical protein
MCATPREAPRNSAPARAGGPAPIYIVCSPSRQVPPKARDELRTWIRRFRFQLREIELCLIYEQILSGRGEAGEGRGRRSPPDCRVPAI